MVRLSSAAAFSSAVFTEGKYPEAKGRRARLTGVLHC